MNKAANGFFRVAAVMLALAVMLSAFPFSVIGAAAAQKVFTFTVTDIAQSPLKGAQVSVFPPQEGEPIVMTTGAQGTASFDLDEGTAYRYEVSLYGYQTVAGEVDWEAGKADVTLMPASKAELKGKVTDSEDTPLPNVAVRLECQEDKRDTQTGPDGSFTFADVYEGETYTLTATLAEYKTHTVTVSDFSRETAVKLTRKESDPLKFSQSSVEITYGETVPQNIATGEKSQENADKYESSVISVATVDNSGKVTVIGVGTTKITATKSENEDYLNSSASYILTVNAGKQSALKWKNPVPQSLSWKETFTFSVSGGSGNGAVTYSVDKAEVAEIDPSSGVLTPKKPGQITVTATKAGEVKDGQQLYEDASITASLTLTKAKQATLTFTQPDEEYSVVFGETFANPATGGSVSGKITYAVEDSDIASVDENGTVTPLQSGRVKVTATLKGDEFYDDVSASYILNIQAAEQKNFHFLILGESFTVTFGDKFFNPALFGENKPIKYDSSDQTVATVDEHGNVTTLKQGKTVITATSPQDGRFDSKTIQYTLIVQRAEQTVVFETENIPQVTYGDDGFQNTASAKTTITYTSSKPETVAVDEATGKLTYLQSGIAIIKATAAETDQYKSAYAEYTISVGLAEQTVTFQKGSEVTVTFNDNENLFVNPAISDKQGAVNNVTYSTDSNLVEHLDVKSGQFTIKGAGTIIVRATIDEDKCYQGASGTYILTVEKDDQTIAFDRENYTLTSGHDFPEGESPKATEQGKFYGTGAITYAYQDDSNGIVKTFSPTDGALDLTYRLGTVTVTATKKGDINYKDASASYQLTVSPWVPEKEENYYHLDGNALPGNEWFRSAVSLFADNGCQVGITNEKGTEWFNSIPDMVTEDGENHSITFYLKNAQGDISDKITLSVKKDGTPPSVSLSKEAPSFAFRFLEIILFGTWHKDTVEYTAEASDELSGNTKIEYYLDTTGIDVKDREALDKISDWQPYDQSISVSKDQAFVVYVKATDAAGNVEYTDSHGVIFDATPPSISLTPSDTGNDYENGFYTGDALFDLAVTDKQPSSGIQSVDYTVTVNGSEKISQNLFTCDPSAEEEQQRVFRFPESGNFLITVPSTGLSETDRVTLTVTVKDLAGNLQTETLENLRIISSPAVVLLSPIAEGYYRNPQTVTVTVCGKPDSFDENKVHLTVTATDAAGKPVADDLSPYYTLGAWSRTQSGDHVAECTFRGNANYRVGVTYEEPKGMIGEAEKELSFTVDAEKPTGKVSIGSLGAWETLLEKLTFGLWSRDILHVTAIAEDAISAPDVRIDMIRLPDKTAKTQAELEALAPETWKTYEPFDVKTDEVFTVYLKLTDAAGNVAYISSDGIILDTEKSRITIRPKEAANENGYYNRDVPIVIEVTEENKDVHSGLKSIIYRVENNGEKTQEGTLFTFERANPAYEELVDTWNSDEAGKEVVVDAQKNNSDAVSVVVTVTDNAGNVQEDEIALKIDVTKPKIRLTYDRQTERVYSGRGYFMTERTATVVITERTSTFDPEQATAGLVFSGTDASGAAVELNREAMIVDWEEPHEGATPDEATHTAHIHFTEDANYTFSVSYTDKAGNANEPVDTGDSVTPYTFTVDKEAPSGVITAGNNSWDVLLYTLTFGLWSRESVTVSASVQDATSPVTVEYFKTDATDLLSFGDLEKIDGWALFSGLTVSAAERDERFTVYLRITDYAGNRIYLQTDGHVVEKTAPKLTLTPQETSIEHNGIGVYNGDVTVLIRAQESDPYSGIQKVEYWVECAGRETQRETLFTYEYIRDTGIGNNGGDLTITEGGQETSQYGFVPTFEDLQSSFEQVITVDAEKNNSCDVSVTVGVTDNAGNYAQESVSLDIDITAPVISVSFNNNAVHKTVGERGYYPSARTATVTVTERTGHFNAQQATDSLKIQAVNAKGEPVRSEAAGRISGWTTTEHSNENTATHTATVEFSADANYDFSLSYTDLDGWENGEIDTEGCITPYHFTVDKTAPTGTVTVESLGTWDKLIEVLTFGLWSKDTVSVTGTSDDLTSPIDSVDYYKTPDIVAKTVEELENIFEWAPFTSLSVSPNERFAIYLRITDNAGNVTYISTDGIIVDDRIPVFEQVQPEITLTPLYPEDGVFYPEDGVYQSNVTVSVRVIDPNVGAQAVYSGLREIRYEVTNLGNITQSGVLFNFVLQNPTQPQLLQLWKKQDAIVVDSALNNSNQVLVRVFATDNAGNENEEEISLQIDVTPPEISVRYDNNDGDTSFAEGTYFNADRRATITVTERNFDPQNVTLSVTNTDGPVPVLSEWSTALGSSENGDDIRHIATLLYHADGDYRFDISLTDRAGNANTPVDYGTSLAPVSFTVDQTLPVIQVTYDNNAAANGNYYNAPRIGTVTVTEHNFETSRALFTLNATDNGVQASLPTVSGWSSSGDVHTATVRYAQDSLYSFDFAYTDMAGNAAPDIPEQQFYVDQTQPEVTIQKVSANGVNRKLDESANTGEGNIGFVITATDTNFDIFTPELTAVVRSSDTFEVRQLEVGSFSETANGRRYTVSNLDTDGIYTVRCTVIDKAGNAFTQIHLEDSQGNDYVENRSGEDDLVTFSVNRFGSTFMLGQSTADMVDQYYVQRVTEDLTVIEINADPIQERYITSGGEDIHENEGYTVTEEGGNGDWFRYTYRVSRSLFDEEGEYRVVVSSKDKAENDAFSDVKDAAIEFVVDRTAPVVTVTGLAQGGRYQTERQTVTVTPIDDGGALRSLTVRMVEADRDGNVTEILSEPIRLSGEELATVLEENDGHITFEVAEGLYQNVQILCDDQAVDENGDFNTFDTVITNVSVSSNAFMIFWANRPLRYGIIGGVALVALAVFLLIILLKRKKEKEQEEEVSSAQS